MRKILKYKEAFTLTELSVLLAMGVILASVLAADLSQTRMKLLQQACAANLKQWGMAISMYADDWNGSFAYEWGVSYNFDDTTGTGYAGTVETNAYASYLGEGDPNSMIRTMRLCPFTRAGITQAQFSSEFIHSYSMPNPPYVFSRGEWTPATPSIAPEYFDNNGAFWPSLRSMRNPAMFLLLLDCSGHTVKCGGLVNAVNGIPAGDITPAIARHGGSVNCLFGDSHVELVSSNKIAQQDAISCNAGNPWFELN